MTRIRVLRLIISTNTQSQSAAEAVPVLEEVLIEPAGRFQLWDFAELWRFRELLVFLTWRDVKVRYKQTLLGVAWSVIQPVLMMVVFTVVFGRMAKVETGGFPYPIFVYAGLLPWTFFSNAISNCANSVVKSERLITKVYFPRLIVPLASVGVALVDLLIAFVVLAALMVWYEVSPGANLILVVPLLVVTVMAAVGIGIVLAALNVSYRDFRYVVPFLVQIWLFATPTVYMETNPATTASAGSIETSPVVDESASGSSNSTDPTKGDHTNIPQSIRSLLALNPMTGLISAFRSAILNQPIRFSELAISCGIVSTTLLIGMVWFRRVEDSFADII